MTSSCLLLLLLLLWHDSYSEIPYIMTATYMYDRSASVFCL